MNQKRLKTRERGFTLVELLAVLIVLVSIGSIVVLILFNSLKGTSRTNSETKVREAGNFVMNRVSREIQFAQAFSGVRVLSSGAFSKSVCEVDTSVSPTPLTQFKYVKILDQNREEVTYSCEGNPLVIKRTTSDGTLNLFNSAELQIKDNNCYFTCSQTFLTDSPTIGINFTLTDNSRTSFIPFKTSVTMRNLNR